MATVVLGHPEPHVTLVTLNRPERLNAMNYELVASLHDALDQIGQDPECRVAILTGAGRGFCCRINGCIGGFTWRNGRQPVGRKTWLRRQAQLFQRLGGEGAATKRRLAVSGR